MKEAAAEKNASIRVEAKAVDQALIAAVNTGWPP